MLYFRLKFGLIGFILAAESIQWVRRGGHINTVESHDLMIKSLQDIRLGLPIIRNKIPYMSP